MFAAFAGLLGAVIYRHAMYLDEAQAWLIARSSLPVLFHQLHYEAHPALWYLLLYLPAHLSSHMQWIQAINFGLSLLMAWFIISERKVPFAARGLLLFSPAIFFAMGTLARSYMLAGLLLVAAVRCLTAERPRHWLAIALLALAINTHFFAIPVAGAIFVFLYWFRPTTRWATGKRALHGSPFSGILSDSVACPGALLFNDSSSQGCLPSAVPRLPTRDAGDSYAEPEPLVALFHALWPGWERVGHECSHRAAVSPVRYRRSC